MLFQSRVSRQNARSALARTPQWSEIEKRGSKFFVEKSNIKFWRDRCRPIFEFVVATNFYVNINSLKNVDFLNFIFYIFE